MKSILKVFGVLIPTIVIVVILYKPALRIEVAQVIEREIYGGLGSSGPIGGITEFFVPELSAPILSLGGLHEKNFPNKEVFIVKRLLHDYVCPQEAYEQNCIRCEDCGEAKTQAHLKRFQKANREKTRKKLIAGFSNPAMIDQGANNRVEFQIPGKQVLSLVTEHDAYGPHAEPLKQFMYEKRIYILKAEDDPAYYICPDLNFSPGCYTCIDCADKLNLIQSYSKAL